MKYAWYIEDSNAGVEFCGINDIPMDVEDALSLTHDMSAEVAFSCPAFPTEIVSDKVDYGASCDIDGIHSLYDEICFENWDGQNYMIHINKHSSHFEISSTIKKLYNKSYICRISNSASNVTIVWKDSHINYHKYIFSADKNFENASFLKNADISESDYYSIQDFCEKLVNQSKTN